MPLSGSEADDPRFVHNILAALLARTDLEKRRWLFVEEIVGLVDNDQVVILDFEVNLIRVGDLLAMISEQRSESFLVAMQQIVVWNHDCNAAVFARDAGHQSYASYN